MKNFGSWRLAAALSRLAVLATFFTLTLAFCSSSVVAEAPGVVPRSALKNAPAQTLPVRRLDSALAGGSVPATRRGAVVVDLASGETLFSRNAQAGLAPASNEKLAVAFAALTLLGPEYRIATEALGEGEQDGTEWVGDIVLKGYGDPDLSKADLKTLALRLRAQGIRSISGDLLGDESNFDRRRVAPGWKRSARARAAAISPAETAWIRSGRRARSSGPGASPSRSRRSLAPARPAAIRRSSSGTRRPQTATSARRE